MVLGPFTLSSRKNFPKGKRAKRKGAGQNLIFYSAVNAVGANVPKPALLVQEPPPKIRTEPF
jgi:hypothetical protein